MHRLLADKGPARQRGYCIDGIFKGLKKTFAPVVKKGLANLGKQALRSGVLVLENVSRREDVKLAIKRGAVEREKKMGKKSINRAPARKIISRKQTVKGIRPTTSKKKKVSVQSSTKRYFIWKILKDPLHR